MKGKLRVIYTPSGRAGEYANHGYALNLYTTCPHSCGYCYNICGRFQKAETYFTDPKPRKDVIKLLKRDLADIGKVDEPIFLSFVGDPFPYGYDHSLTWQAIAAIHESGNSVRILTKNPRAALPDNGVFLEGDEIGTTLVFAGADDCCYWEKGAPFSLERVAALRDIKRTMPQVKVWVSFEPVIEPEESLAMAKLVAQFVDVMKFGKLNHANKLDERYQRLLWPVNWRKFAQDVIALMEEIGFTNYVLKEDLKRELEVSCGA